MTEIFTDEVMFFIYFFYKEISSIHSVIQLFKKKIKILSFSSDISDVFPKLTIKTALTSSQLHLISLML